MSELTTREEEMAKIAEEKFNSESNKKREVNIRFLRIIYQINPLKMNENTNFYTYNGNNQIIK